MHVQSYLFFNGRCEEALEFYRRTLGAEVTRLMRFKESPQPHQPGMVPPGSENKVMHAAFRIGDTELMASDGECKGQPKFEGMALSLFLNTPAEGDKVFAALSDGGKVQMPMTPTFFAERFGMVADKFGVSWMLLVAKKQ
jgi:PhnB protein